MRFEALFKCVLNKEDQLNNENIQKQNFQNYLIEIKIKYTKIRLQKVKDLFENIDTYMQCYRQYTHHFKKGFHMFLHKVLMKGK